MYQANYIMSGYTIADLNRQLTVTIIGCGWHDGIDGPILVTYENDKYYAYFYDEDPRPYWQAAEAADSYEKPKRERVWLNQDPKYLVWCECGSHRWGYTVDEHGNLLREMNSVPGTPLGFKWVGTARPGKPPIDSEPLWAAATDNQFYHIELVRK